MFTKQAIRNIKDRVLSTKFYSCHKKFQFSFLVIQEQKQEQLEVFVEYEQQLHGPHAMLDVVKLKAKILHLEIGWWSGVTSLLYEFDHYHDHPIVQHLDSKRSKAIAPSSKLASPRLLSQVKYVLSFLATSQYWDYNLKLQCT